MKPQPVHRLSRLGKPLIFIASLLPLVWLCWLAWQDRLGVNPVEMLSHQTGGSLSAADPGGDAAAAADRLEWADQIPANAGAIRLFLRLPALRCLFDFRPVFRLGRHRRRRGQTAVHHGRVRRLAVADPAGGHLHQRDDQAAGTQLAAIAPAGDCTGWFISSARSACCTIYGWSRPISPNRCSTVGFWVCCWDTACGGGTLTRPRSSVPLAEIRAATVCPGGPARPHNFPDRPA